MLITQIGNSIGHFILELTDAFIQEGDSIFLHIDVDWIFSIRVRLHNKVSPLLIKVKGSLTE
jgi:hypothetical protein